MADVEFVPALGPGETGPILQRHLVASSGPWVIGKSKKADGLFVFPAANLDQPICYVFDSVAQNATFLANSWEDQTRLLASVLRYKGIFGELARQIRASTIRARQAVRAAQGRVAASSQDRFAGQGTTPSSSSSRPGTRSTPTSAS